MLGNLKVLLGQTGGTAGIQVDQSICQRAFADGFHYEPAGNILAFSDQTILILKADTKRSCLKEQVGI